LGATAERTAALAIGNSHTIAAPVSLSLTSPEALVELDAGAHTSQTYESLRKLVLDGRYPPGSRLKEAELATLLGVSRTPVREALLQLEGEGLVQLIHNRGAIVRELTPADVHEILILRAMIEAFCASTAATNMDEAAIEELEAVQAELERVALRPDRSGRAEALAALNADFHQVVIAGSGNARIPALLDKLVVIPTAWKIGYWDARREREAAVVYHRAVIDAIRARDPLRADAVMKSHIYAAKDYFVDQMIKQKAVG
jgi:DNA-binding GntR family transcriptional regulator